MLLLWSCNSQDGKTYMYGGCVTITAHGRKYLFHQYLQGLRQTTETMKRTSLVAQLVKDCLQCRRLWFDFWVGRNPWRMDRLRTPVFLGFPVHHQLPEFTQTHVLWVGDAIQSSYPLSSPSHSALNLSQQGLFKWVSSLHQMAKVLEHSRTLTK